MKIGTIVLDEPKRLLFMSDLHYGHRNIIKMGNRPFLDVEGMNKWLSKSLSEEIRRTDIVIDLGDMFWKTSEGDAIELISNINAGTRYKVLGNHDYRDLWSRDGFIRTTLFDTVCDILEFKVILGGVKYRVVCSHYPLLSWNHKSRGSINIHGHCHGNLDEFNKNSPDLRLDVGVDSVFCKQYGKGGIVVDFKNIIEQLKIKTGGLDFMTWAQTKCTEL